MKKSEYIEMEYSELESLIQKEFNLPYDFNLPCDLETSNDTTHTFTAERKPLETYESSNFEAALKKEKSFMTGTFINELCNRGKLEPGKYLINICW